MSDLYLIGKKEIERTSDGLGSHERCFRTVKVLWEPTVWDAITCACNAIRPPHLPLGDPEWSQREREEMRKWDWFLRIHTADGDTFSIPVKAFSSLNHMAGWL